MHPWLAAQARKHLRMTSVTRWEVSTLPPTTAAVAEGFSRHPLGMRISTGARHPCVHHTGEPGEKESELKNLDVAVGWKYSDM